MLLKFALRFFVLPIAIWCSPAAAQTIVYVDDDAPLGGDGMSWATAYREVQDALVFAGANEHVHVAGGLYRPDRGANQVAGAKDSTFLIREGMHLRGGFRGLAGGGNPDDQDPGTFPSTLSGDLAANDPARLDNAYHVVTMGALSFARLEGFTVRSGGDGYGSYPGAGLFKNGGGDLQVSACAFIDNRTDVGGALHAAGATLSIDSSTFRSNSSGSSGGAINLSYLTATVSSTVFDQNSGGSNPGGGAINVAGGALTVTACQFTGNNSGSYGGAIHCLDNQLSLQGCTFDANTSTGGAGCIRLRSTNAQMQNCTLSNSSSLSLGGAIQLDHQAWLSAVQCSFSNNSIPYSAGGAIFATDAGADLTDCQFGSNHAGGQGGAIFSDATLILTRCQFVANHATQSGAGVYLDAIYPTTSVIDDCDFTANVANDSGGGMTYVGTPGSALQIFNTRFIQNVSNRTGAGLLLNGGADSVFIQDSVFTRNSNVLFGGAGLGVKSQPTTLLRCEISRNSTAESTAAGIRVESASALLERCTIAENSVAGTTGSAAGIYGLSAIVTVHDSILWANRDQNSSGQSEQLAATGGSLSLNYSCVQGLTGSLGGVGNLAGNPTFWDFANHDYHLRHTSPCIDSGDPASLPDPDGSIADMGAYSFDPLYCGPPIAYCDSKLNSVGCLPQISAAGAASASASSGFTVQATFIRNNKPGLLLYSTQGTAYNSFQGAHLCVAAPVRRTPGVSSGGSAAPIDDCSGVLAIDFNAFAAGFLGGTPTPALRQGGTIVYAQWWSRDPGDFYGSSLSNALEFTICP